MTIEMVRFELSRLDQEWPRTNYIQPGSRSPARGAAGVEQGIYATD